LDLTGAEGKERDDRRRERSRQEEREGMGCLPIT